jgi:hypothetical protein
MEKTIQGRVRHSEQPVGSATPSQDRLALRPSAPSKVNVGDRPAIVLVSSTNECRTTELSMSKRERSVGFGIRMTLEYVIQRRPKEGV